MKFIHKKNRVRTFFISMILDDSGKILEASEEHILNYLEKRYMQGEIYVRNHKEFIRNNHTEPHFIYYSLQIMRNYVMFPRRMHQKFSLLWIHIKTSRNYTALALWRWLIRFPLPIYTRQANYLFWFKTSINHIHWFFPEFFSSRSLTRIKGQQISVNHHRWSNRRRQKWISETYNWISMWKKRAQFNYRKTYFGIADYNGVFRKCTNNGQSE